MSKLNHTHRGVVTQVVRQCGDCEENTSILLHHPSAGGFLCIICFNPESDHYRHVLMQDHPACSEFKGRE